jgi:hypothetical protein
MHTFDDVALIPALGVFRAALVSQEAGQRELRRLAEAGAISPTRTPTGRILMTPSDARLVYESLLKRGA